MISRARLAAAALAGLITVILGFAAYRKIRQPPTQTAPEQSAETPGSESPLYIDPTVLPHVPGSQTAAIQGSQSSPSEGPAAQPKPYTNEALYNFLEQDMRRLGIKKIYTQDELKALKSPVKPAKNYSLEADWAKIRAMAHEIQAVVEARKKAPIVLSGDKVKLLSSPEDSYSAGGSPLSGDKSGIPPVNSQK